MNYLIFDSEKNKNIIIGSAGYKEFNISLLNNTNLFYYLNKGDKFNNILLNSNGSNIYHYSGSFILKKIFFIEKRKIKDIITPPHKLLFFETNLTLDYDIKRLNKNEYSSKIRREKIKNLFNE